MTLRSSLLFDIGVRASEHFSEVINNFLTSQFQSAETTEDELKNNTFMKIRNCRSNSNKFSVESVFIVLTNLGWFTRVADDSNSDLRTLRPTVSTSTSPYNVTMRTQADNRGNDAVMKVDECEENEPDQRKDFCSESLIPETFSGAVKWACSDRALHGPFKSFMNEYSEWTQKSENANLLHVKGKMNIKVTNTTHVVLSLCGHLPKSHRDTNLNPNLNPNSDPKSLPTITPQLFQPPYVSEVQLTRTVRPGVFFTATSANVG